MCTCEHGSRCCQLIACGACRHIWVHTQPSLQELVNYRGSESSQKIYNWTIKPRYKMSSSGLSVCPCKFLCVFTGFTPCFFWDWSSGKKNHQNLIVEIWLKTSSNKFCYSEIQAEQRWIYTSFITMKAHVQSIMRTYKNGESVWLVKLVWELLFVC